MNTIFKTWSSLFWETTGEKYIPTWGRDNKILNALAKECGESELLALLKYYFTTQQRVYSLPFFRAGINELKQRRKADIILTKPVMKDKY